MLNSILTIASLFLPSLSTYKIYMLYINIFMKIDFAFITSIWWYAALKYNCDYLLRICQLLIGIELLFTLYITVPRPLDIHSFIWSHSIGFIQTQSSKGVTLCKYFIIHAACVLLRCFKYFATCIIVGFYYIFMLSMVLAFDSITNLLQTIWKYLVFYL